MKNSHALVYTEDPGGGNRVFLDRLIPGELSAVSGLKWSKVYPGGDQEWSCNLSTDPNLSHVGLNLGRRVVIVKGGAIRFQGTMKQAARGTPWQLQGPGAYAAVVNSADSGGFMAVAPVSGNAYNLDDVVAAAQTRGLPWTAPAPLPGAAGVATAGTAATASCDIATAFSTVGKALGLGWSLTSLLAITMAPPPTTVSYVLRLSQPLAPTLTGYTQAVGLFSGGVVLAQNDAAIDKWGHIEAPYDMSALEGTADLTSDLAQTYLNNWLTVNLPYPTYTSPLTVQPGQLRAVNGNSMGGPVDLATVEPGCLINVYDIDPDHSHLLEPGPLQILVGQTDYDDDADLLSITPVGAVGTDLMSALYRAAGGSL